MWHSCGHHSVDDFLTGKSDRALAFWGRLVEMVSECGSFEFHAARTRIGFMVRTRFAGLTSLSDRGMTISFWLKEQLEDPRFARVDHLGGRDWVYSMRLTSIDELDGELQTWLCQAYQVGCQEA